VSYRNLHYDVGDIHTYDEDRSSPYVDKVPILNLAAIAPANGV
jgi:hypothetical protein